MPKPAIVYHWWNDRNMHVWEDWQNPILVSIASLRAHDPDVPVYVLDVSDGERNWLDYPHKLNFKYIRTGSKIPLLRSHEIYGSSYKICSRQFDIEWLAGRIPEDLIVSVESDFFWQGKLEPPDDVDRFHFNFYNSGFYFYNKKAELAKQFLAVWKHYILLGMANPRVRADVMSKYEWQHFQDEACMVYIVKSFGGIAAPIDDRHNVLYNPEKDYAENYKDALTLHLIQAFFPKNRGLVPLMVKEFYEVIRSVLAPQELYDIYGPSYEHYAGSIAANDLKHTNLALVKRGKDYLLDSVSKLMS